MRGKAQRIYFDANVLLAYVSDEEGRAAVVAELLRKASAGELIVLTSTVSIAEVAFGAQEKLERALDEDAEARIDALWAPGAPVVLVEASRGVLVEARSLIRKNLAAGHGRLTVIDAIHLATAVIENVEGFATYETRTRERWSDLTGLDVTEPSLAQPPLDFGSEAPE